jgi:Mg/Co/Ni transporter MgtE
LAQLFEGLREEGFAVSFTMEDFQRQYAREHFPQLTAREQTEALQLLTPERRREILQSLPAEQRREILQSLPAEQRRDILQSLPADEVLAALPEEQIRQYLEQRSTQRPEPPPRKRSKK